MGCGRSRESRVIVGLGEFAVGGEKVRIARDRLTEKLCGPEKVLLAARIGRDRVYQHLRPGVKGERNQVVGGLVSIAAFRVARF